MRRAVPLTFLLWIWLLVSGSPVCAQGLNDGLSAAELGIDGPEPPVPPAVVSRDAEGRVTMRAYRLAEGLVIDGELDDPVYARIPAVSDFVQQEPAEGQPATEKTEVWVFFDDRNVYISGRNWDSHPERMIANEMRRDHRNINQNESFTVVLDTFYDRRNGVFFQTNPLGAIRDQAVTDERNPNNDWNTVWDVKTQPFEQGWTVEMVIPFKSLRYNAGRDQVWGINVRRNVRWKNENSYLTPIPASYGVMGIYKFSSAGTLVGIEAPSGSRNIELKPYAISSLSTSLVSTPPVSNDLGGDVGFDAKYGVTQGLTADFTVNTDFAQVEDDEEQVNLTRFTLFFPEKREFFLEGQGIFSFGGASGRGGGGGGGGFGSSIGRQNLTPILFFSRRIGLGDGGVLPIRAGGRLTGRAGPYTVGLLNIQQGEDDISTNAATNFGVVRLRRDILRRSTVGVIATNRTVALDTPGANQAFGVDADLAFYQNLRVAGFYARSRTEGLAGDTASYQASIDYGADTYGFAYEHLVVGEHFNPEVGFLQRDDLRRNFAGVRYSPRTADHPFIRKHSYEASFDYITDTGGRLETRDAKLEFGLEMHNGDRFDVSHNQQYEYLDEAFTIATGVTLPIGGYEFQETSLAYFMGPSRRFTGRLGVNRGSFYNGDRTQLSYFGRFEVTPKFSLEPRVSLNWIDLVQGSFTTTLVSSRANFTLTPRMFVGALLQYNSASNALSTNVRLKWEYSPGSDFFVVYSEGRNTELSGFPTIQNRGFVVKYTRLMRF